MNSAFAFLDSNFETPQHLQMLVIKNFACNNNISISFYGNEPVGYESRHKIFLEYLQTGKDNSYLFFTLDQLTIDGYKLDLSIILMALNRSVNLYFASENLKIKNINDLKDIQLLLYSKNQKTLV